VIEGHFAEQLKRRAKPAGNRRGLVVVKDLLDEGGIFDCRRRDRGVRVRSKMAPVQPRNKRRKQLALAD
jgi:hypothetical protein